MITIFFSIKSKKSDIAAFLKDLKLILDKEDFDLDSDIIIIRKQKPNDFEHSTPYTLMDLDYDISDVVERLKELKVEEYSETLFDRDDSDPPLLFVFGKILKGKRVYIKLKIKGNEKKRVLCVSFHYAKNEMKFPYA